MQTPFEVQMLLFRFLQAKCLPIIVAYYSPGAMFKRLLGTTVDEK